VGAEVVHDDDVARLQHRDELLLDIGAEALAVDRSVEDTRSDEAVAAQRAEEGQGAPVAMRGEAAQAFALRPQPRSGAMLVLIQVSSMKTKRRGSSPACQDRQR
jgi:hypothetical protein